MFAIYFNLIFFCVAFRHGPFPIHFPQWHMIEYNMQLCLAGIKAVDR